MVCVKTARSLCTETVRARRPRLNWRALIAQRELTAGSDDHGVRHAKEWHSRVLFDLGRFDEAELEIAPAVGKELDRVLGTDDQEAVEVHENHAATRWPSWTGCRKPRRKWPAWSRNGSGGRRGADDVVTLRARASRAVCLDALGRIGESATAWRELCESQARVHGASHPDAIFRQPPGMRMRCTSSGAFLRPLRNIQKSKRSGPPHSAPIIRIQGARRTGCL